MLLEGDDVHESHVFDLGKDDAGSKKFSNQLTCIKERRVLGCTNETTKISEHNRKIVSKQIFLKLQLCIFSCSFRKTSSLPAIFFRFGQRINGDFDSHPLDE